MNSKTKIDENVKQAYGDENIIRFYFALTNFCNRACELCSCHSDPTKKTFLSFEQYKDIINNGIIEAQKEGKTGHYETQLEGGEPTVHPEFLSMLNYSLEDEFCNRIIICTNAVKIPFDHDENKSIEKIKKWINMFSEKPFILKPSINSHLIKHSKIHMQKMIHIKKAWEEMIAENQLKEGSFLYFNVRRIPHPMTEDSETWITKMTEEMGLSKYCNNYEYQRYGKAKNEEFLKEPYIVSNHVKFNLIAPDGKDFGHDLISRAEYMENMI